jgi:hypothetical protein
MRSPLTIHIVKFWMFYLVGHQSGSGMIKCLFALNISMYCDCVLILVLKVIKKHLK